MMTLGTAITTFFDVDNLIVDYLARFDSVGKSVGHFIDEDIFEDIIMCITTRPKRTWPSTFWKLASDLSQ